VSTVTDLPEKPLSVASLVLCCLLLAVPARVYSLLERLQTILLVAIFVGVLGLCLLAVSSAGSTAGFWASFLSGEGAGACWAELFRRKALNSWRC
jgi:hypothetical protein